jgi:hypothetical protein
VLPSVEKRGPATSRRGGLDATKTVKPQEKEEEYKINEETRRPVVRTRAVNE